MIVEILASILLVLFVFNWYQKTKIPDKFPNGPFGFPLIGYASLLKGGSILDILDELHTKFGGTYSVNLGPSPRLVVVGEYETLKGILRHDWVTARPPEMHWANKYFRHGNGHDARGLLFR